MLAQLIRESRTRLHLSPEQLAQKAQVPIYNLVAWEKGQSLPSLEELRSLCQVFGYSLDQVIEASGYLKFPDYQKRRMGLLVILFGLPFIAALFTFSVVSLIRPNFITNLGLALLIYMLVYLIILYNSILNFNPFINEWQLTESGFSHLTVGPFKKALLPLILLNKRLFIKDIPFNHIKAITISSFRNVNMLDRAFTRSLKFQPVFRLPVKIHIHQVDGSTIDLDFNSALDKDTVVSYIRYYLESKGIPTSVELIE